MEDLDPRYIEVLNDDLKMLEAIGFVETLGNVAIDMAQQPNQIKKSPEFWQLHEEFLQMDEEVRGKVFYHYGRLLVHLIEEIFKYKSQEY